MKVVIKTEDFGSMTCSTLTWLHNLPKEKQYHDKVKGVRYKGVSYPNVETVYGKGFIIENESDPLFIEFKTKFPNVKYHIED